MDFIIIIMKIILFQLIFSILFPSLIFAQELGIIKGSVVNSTEKPEPLATVSLYNLRDSSLVAGTITDKSGNYNLNVKPGKFFLCVSSIGYEKYYSDQIVLVSNSTIEIKMITLKLSGVNLQEITIKSNKPLFEVRKDKIVVNIEGNVNATGSNALELLQKSPGVAVDQNDNISLKGKSGVQIFIDGRPSQLDSKSLSSMLKSMNSSNIEAIELISNPSSKYEANGTAGIINFRLKKDKKYGFNGNVSSGIQIGRTPKYLNSFSGNYNSGRVNLYGNYSINWGDNRSYINMFRTQADTVYNSKSVQNYYDTNNNFKTGLDIFIDKKSTLGLMITGDLSNGNIQNNSVNAISPVSSGVLNRTLYGLNQMSNSRRNLNYNTNYSYSDTLGHSLNIDFNYGTFRNMSNSFQPNTYIYADGHSSESDFRSRAPIRINLGTAKIDYSFNLFKGKFGTGGKYSDVKADNIFDFWDVVGPEDFYIGSLSNRFYYTEKVSSFYLNYNREINQDISFEIGLRAENTISEGRLVSNDNKETLNDVKRNYTNLFPNVALNYKINEENQLNLNYSRRIKRPLYQDLNPFEIKQDELNYQKGNPFLRPQYADIFEISHVYKSNLVTSLSYTQVKDFIIQITDTAGTSRSYFTTRNLESQKIVNLSLSYSANLFSWWNFNYSLNGNYSSYQGIIGGGEKLNLKAFGYTTWGQNTFKISGNLSGQLSGWFYGPFIWEGTYKNKAMGGFDLGLRSILLRNKATISLILTDVLNSEKWAGTTNVAGRTIYASGGSETRQLKLFFSYPIGRSTIKGSRNRTPGVKEENDRIKAVGTGGLGN